MESKVKRLRERREKLIRDREQAKNRKSYGPAFLKLINQSLKVDIHVDDLDLDMKPKLKFKWTLEQSSDYVKAGACPGLNSGYINRNTAIDFVRCFDHVIESWKGYVGFSEYDYMGHVAVEGVSFVQLLSLAENLQDTIYLYSNSFDGIVMIDFEYDFQANHEKDFTIVVQGENLEQLLADCFKKSKLNSVLG